MQITRVGGGIAKNVFHVHATDRRSHKLWQAKLSRKQWLAALIERHLKTVQQVLGHKSAATTTFIKSYQNRKYVKY